MSASQFIQKKGLPSTAHVVRISGVPKSTLNDWYNNKPKLFICVVMGCLKIKENSEVKQQESV